MPYGSLDHIPHKVQDEAASARIQSLQISSMPNVYPMQVVSQDVLLDSVD
jgi:hypothetical protein